MRAIGGRRASIATGWNSTSRCWPARWPRIPASCRSDGDSWKSRRSNIVVSAMKPGADGTAVLRVYEASGRATTAKIRLPVQTVAAEEVNLMEDPGRKLPVADNTLRTRLPTVRDQNHQTANATAMTMTCKQRMLTALDGGVPDRLPVTTHFIMPRFLEDCMGGISEEEFFDVSGWDPITYTTPHRPAPNCRRILRPGTGRAGLPGKLADRHRQLAGAFRAGFRAEVSGHAIPLRHAQGHFEHGARIRSLHYLGRRAADQGETRHRFDRPIS